MASMGGQEALKAIKMIDFCSVQEKGDRQQRCTDGDERHTERPVLTRTNGNSVCWLRS